ncbi:MAG: DUF2384 domain-containing protein [Phycisphaeraceae bacterium]|nr:DUF2384 domain-containing protein [Phycisphaeraceae bacterium]
MHTPKTHSTRGAALRQEQSGSICGLNIRTDDMIEIYHKIQEGFPYRCLAEFQKTTALTLTELSRFVGIPQRTLTRRQSQGKLQPDESDRVWRANFIFGKAVNLFDGDISAARKWMRTPQPGLGGESPLDFASTDIGAREVEKLIGRLEHGVFA